MTDYVGLDIHKKYFHATVMDEEAGISVQKNFSNDSEGFVSLFAETGGEVEVAQEMI